MLKALNARASLVIGGFAALLASACCLGPLALVTLGFSGAWIGNLTRLEPYRPVFAVVALAALGLAGWQLFRPAQACRPDDVCARPVNRRRYRLLFWSVAALTLLALGFPYIMPLFY